MQRKSACGYQKNVKFKKIKAMELKNKPQPQSYYNAVYIKES